MSKKTTILERQDLCKFMRVSDIAEALQCSESHAYKIMQKLNNELKEKSKIVVAGRLSRRYFEERIY